MKWEKTLKDLENDIWGQGYKIVAKKINLIPYNLTNERKDRDDKWEATPKVENDIPLFTDEEIKKARDRIKNGNTPGPDSIPSVVITMLTIPK